MSNNDERDYAEEKYNREFCIPCGTSPCTWDGKPDGFHTDEDGRTILQAARMAPWHSLARPDEALSSARTAATALGNAEDQAIAAIAEGEQAMAAGQPLVTLADALAEARLADLLIQVVPEHHNDLGDWCPRSGEYSADGACPLYCRHADDIMGIDASRDEEDEEDDRSGTEFGDWLDERPLDEPDTLREMRGQS